MPLTTLELIPDLCGKKILLVDDDKLNQSVAKEILEKFGLSVSTSDSANQAFLLLKENQPDLIFMDLQMPIMSGYEAFDVIHNNPEWQDIPIIALTANASTLEKKKALDYGMDDFLTKPIDPLQLKQALLNWFSPRNSESTHINVDRTAFKLVTTGLTSKEEVEENLKNIVDTLGPEFAIKLFKSTDDVISKEAPQLINLLREHKRSEACDFAHKLKGALGLCCSTKLESLLTQIEVNKVEFNDTETLYTELQIEFNLIKMAIRNTDLSTL